MKILGKVLIGAIADIIVVCDVIAVVEIVSRYVDYRKEKKARK